MAVGYYYCAFVGIIVVHLDIAAASPPTLSSSSVNSLVSRSPMTKLKPSHVAFSTRQFVRRDYHIGFCSITSSQSPQLNSSRRSFLSKSRCPRVSSLHPFAFMCGANASDHNDLLTPATYADSRSAEHRVEGIITASAADAFLSTDFAHEPHLSPELQDAETAYEIALLANAAHEFADMADKENRQSRAAMLEREKESEWIKKYDEETMMEAEALMGEIYRKDESPPLQNL